MAAVYPSARLARIVKVYPDSQTADVRFVDTNAPGWRLPITGVSTGDTGGFDVPDTETSQNPFPTGDREATAVCLALGLNRWIIIGFLPPAKRQGMFEDGRTLNRHQSDIYSSTDKQGNFQWAHPSGIWVRVGTGGKEDLTGKDVDGAFRIKRNTGSTPDVTLGGPDYTLTLKHDGTVSLQCSKAITIETDADATIRTAGDVTLDSTGDTTITSAGDVSVTATGDTTITSTGDVSVTSTGKTEVTATGQAAVTAPAGLTITATTIGLVGAVTVTGALAVTGGMSAGGFSIAEDGAMSSTKAITTTGTLTGGTVSGTSMTLNSYTLSVGGTGTPITAAQGG